MASGFPYQLPEWKALRKEALRRDGHRCTRCGKDVSGWHQSRVDHIQPVKTHPHLALVLGNLRTFCAGCDNKRHWEKGGGPTRGCDADGWSLAHGSRPQEGRGKLSHPDELRPSLIPVHLVCGPPAGGKTTFVRQRASADDLVIDVDLIMADLSGKPSYFAWVRQDWLLPALGKRNEILSSLSEPSRWHQAWFIVGEPKPEWRLWWRDKLGPGNTYVLATPAKDCITRIVRDPTRTHIATEHRNAAIRWWGSYRPAPIDTVISPAQLEPTLASSKHNTQGNNLQWCGFA